MWNFLFGKRHRLDIAKKRQPFRKVFCDLPILDQWDGYLSTPTVIGFKLWSNRTAFRQPELPTHELWLTYYYYSQSGTAPILLSHPLHVDDFQAIAITEAYACYLLIAGRNRAFKGILLNPKSEKHLWTYVAVQITNQITNK